MKGNPTLILKNIFAIQFCIIVHTISKFYINEGIFKTSKDSFWIILCENESHMEAAILSYNGFRYWNDVKVGFFLKKRPF